MSFHTFLMALVAASLTTAAFAQSADDSLVLAQPTPLERYGIEAYHFDYSEPKRVMLTDCYLFEQEANAHGDTHVSHKAAALCADILEAQKNGQYDDILDVAQSHLLDYEHAARQWAIDTLNDDSPLLPGLYPLPLVEAAGWFSQTDLQSSYRDETGLTAVLDTFPDE